MQFDAKAAFVFALVLIVGIASYFAFFAQPKANPMQPSVNVTQDERPPAPPESSRAPSLSISINNGAAATNSPNATLYLDGMNIGRCMFSVGENNWGAYEPFAAQKQIAFNETEGNKSVYVQCVNYDGTQSVGAGAQITLDVKKPSVYVYYPRLLDGGRTIEMGYEAADAQDATPLCKVFVNGAEIESRAMGKKQKDTVSFNSTDVIEDVNVSCVDWAGNIGYKEVFSAGAEPVWIKIENGSRSTPTRSVLLYLYARNASECRYRNEEHDWSVWSNYTGNRSWSLSDGYGNKTVYYNCIRRDGSEVGIASASINYYSSGGIPEGGTSGGSGGGNAQQNAPANLQVGINNGAAYTHSSDVTLSLSASNAQQCSYSADNSAWALSTPYAASRQFTLLNGDGMRYVYYQCSNQYGASEIASDSIIVDSTPPPAVTGLSASPNAQSGSIYLSWGGNDRPAAYGDNAVQQYAAPVSYEVYRQTGAALNGIGGSSGTGGGAYFGTAVDYAMPVATLMGTTANNYFEDGTVLDGQSYTYSVRAVDAAGNSAQSASTASAADFYTLGVTQSSPRDATSYVGAVSFAYSVMLGGGAKADCKIYVDYVEKDSRTLQSSQSLSIPITLSSGAHVGKVSCKLQKSVRAAVNTQQVSFYVGDGGGGNNADVKNTN